MSGLSFLAPLALGAAALVALPVVAHMLRRARSRSVEFPSLQFLRETPSFARALTRPNRLWLLALRILVVAAIAAAIARPVVVPGVTSAASRAVVIAIDASASMARPGVRERAVEEARRVLASLAPSDRAAIVAFGSDFSLLGDLAEPGKAGAALDAYAPGYTEANPPAAVASASRLLASVPERRRTLVVISDFQASNGPWSTDSLDASIAYEPVDVGSPFDNTFLSGAAARRDIGRYVAMCGVVRIHAETRELVHVTAEMPDHGTHGIVVEPTRAGWRATIVEPDGFDADDVRYFVAPPPVRVVVCDPGPGASYLSAAAATEFGDDAVTTVSNLASGLPDGSTVALVGARALADAASLARLGEWIGGGGRAIVFSGGSVTWPFPAPEGDPRAADGLVLTSSTTVTQTELGGELLACRVPQFRAVRAGQDDEIVLRSIAGNAIAVRRSIGRGWVTVVGFEPAPESAPFVRTGTFPAFVAAVVSTGTPDTAIAGRRLSGLGPDARVTAPDGSTVALEPGGSFIPRVPGIYDVTSSGAVRSVAVNIAPGESEPLCLSSDIVAALSRDGTTASGTSAAELAAIEDRQGLWRFVLAFAVLLAFVELALATIRRAAPPLDQ